MTDMIDRSEGLKSLLLKATGLEEESKCVPLLAQETGLARESIYKWIRRGKISPKRAQEIVSLSWDPLFEENRVSIEEFTPFFF